MRASQQKIRAFMAETGGEVAVSEFHALLFLYCRDQGLSTFDFVSKPEGVFSFTAAFELEKLTRSGLVIQSGDVVRLNDASLQPLTVAARNPTLALRGEALLARVSSLYPSAPSAPRPDFRLYTIGYEGRSLEKYLNALVAARVTTLCDVRKNPLSRKFGFSKNTLLRACADVGLRYRHIPDLGIASELRKNLKTRADYDSLFERYRRTTLAQQAPALKELAALVDAGETIALTCYELLPEQCHRGSLAQAMQAICNLAAPAQHL